ncbi:class I SAM-dependent methyltransferase [Massilia sp. YIM B02769]|uniref:class I SAM-dependent methyltransferase n=1 Tax=Massilia sp. YIM B02769 TaxID=3050129 RepID=UPI0025B6AEDA|nr:class I SAM-dependent methyltransferase [Massilia sp. YIM B02769]MDN4058458.1 class I SAM-dependent methyltransferase [Massilia sp. YIM B02769]
MGTQASGQGALWNSGAGNAWVEEQAVIDQMFRQIETLLVNAAASGAATRVLDVGCGTGGTTLALARRLGRGARCTGIDISEPMIASARRQAGQEGLPVDFVCADAQHHRFEPGTFDVVVSRFGVMFFDDPVAAFANLRQATRSGGRLHVVVWRSAEENPFMTAAEHAARPLLPGLPVRQTDEAGQFGFAREGRVRDIVTRAGWRDVRMEPVDVPCRFPESELIGYLSRMGPVGRALDSVDTVTREGVISKVHTAFNAFVSGESVSFRAACWLVSAQ